MKEFLGWPVVTAENCFDVVRERGIKPWKAAQEPEALDNYLLCADDFKKEEYSSFGPRNYIVRYWNPSTHCLFNGFRTVFKPAAVVFAMIDGMIPVTAEWKHGNDRITIVPVAGVPGKKEQNLPTFIEKMRATAFREWNEETGTFLKSVTLLAPLNGIYSLVRNAEMQYFPFLGELELPIEKGPSRCDQNENLIMILFPLAEWVILIESPGLWCQNPDFGLEICARDVTYAALRKLGLLQLLPA